ncbi:glycoside hydrolase family 78 protein [Pseudarthrobacter sp. R1]|uniref:alpha-L-rhamnosidase n=1 Tax=Pseudarthrobacter sp. R1 TaxID=2944934 RepID=UPI0021088C8D|nr:alpha-L-rhamnosidase [Pseudarthrobacter sp. R1]MCQ6270674.1 glycoside hydrolase family 78 protein [Pseudarthrobacter sp. R1]
MTSISLDADVGETLPAPYAPTRLRVEHLREAMGITSTAPRLSWTPPAGAISQVAYRITASNGWDTGRVESADHILVPYAGPALESRSGFEWRVRTWTTNADSAETQSAWSEAMAVELGLLHTADWTAQWIGPDEQVVPAPGERPGYALDKAFSLDAAPESARAYATAHGIYELFLNGQRIGDQQLTPGSTSYNTRLQVQAYDIAALLRPGINTLRAVLTDGWYRGTFGYTRDADMYGTRTALLVQLEILSAGSRTVIGTDESWLVSPTEILTADLMAGQRVDFRRPGNAAANGSGVQHARAAVVRNGSYETLTGPVAPPTRIVEELTPVSVTRLSSGHQVVDFGQNIHGWVRLTRLGAPGETVTLAYGEALDSGGDVGQDHLRPHDFRNPGQFLAAGQVDEVSASGAPGEVFEPRHTTHGFQYVSVQGLSPDLTAEDITACLVQTDLEPLGTFTCSDERLNKLHDIVQWSFRDNACEVPTDCPQREKAGWTGDWQLFIPTAAYLFDVAGFSRKWLNDVRADQWANGVVANISPSPGPDATSVDFMAFVNGSAGWGDAIVMVPWELYLATGDAGVLAENWEAMKRWLDFVRTTAESRRHPDRAAASQVPAPHEQYLWDTSFHWGEWMEPDGPEPDLFAARSADHGIVATAYYRNTTALMAKIARVLGHVEEAAALAGLSENVRQAWEREYLDPAGHVTQPSQANCVRALAFNLAGPGQRAAVTAQLVSLIRAAGTHVGTGFLATPYLLPVLADNGEPDLAYELLMQDSEPSWLVMVDRGATTMWELWNGIDAGGSPHQSLNHYSKGAVVSFLHRYTAGLRQAPGSAGYERIIIEPRPGAGLTSAATSHQGPHGLIEVEWTACDGGLQLRATVPFGTTAEVRLPGQPAVAAGPGKHHFTATGGTHATPELARSAP